MSRDDLQRLADDAGAAAEPPRFAGLVARARRRRRVRRTTTGVAGLAAVAAIAVAAITVPGQVESGPTAPAPSSSRSPSPSPPSTKPPTRHYLLHHPTALVHQPGAHIVYVSYADRNHAAALWEACSPVVETNTCPEVVTWTSDDWATSRAAVIPDKLDIYALPDGSAVVWLYGSHSFVLGPDGGRHSITVAHNPLHRRPGGPLTNLSSASGARPVGMFDARNDTVYPPLTSTATRCVHDDQWDAHGTLWEYGTPHCGRHQQMWLAWSSDLGSTWSTKRLPGNRVLEVVVGGGRTAILLSGTVKGQQDVLQSLLTTTDGGRTWHRTLLPPDSRTPVWSAAATADGHLFISDGADVWRANSAWSALHLLRPGHLTASGVTAVGPDVIAAYGGDSTKIAISSDDGRTWHLVSPRP